MKKSEILVKCAIAGLVAGSFGVSPTTASADSKVKCYGSNGCSGQGACGGKTLDGKSYSCHGNNECKGQGWEHKASKAECEKVGGVTDKAKFQARMEKLKEEKAKKKKDSM